MSLPEAIHKMTGASARRLGLKGRGLIAPENVADLVVLDPCTVIDRATFDDPQQYPVGIPHVMVAGEPVIMDGKHTGARPGRILRRGER
jgi:N-acyl-D-amino-acid deacylase